MNILAMDLSSEQAGVALVAGNTLLAESHWKQERRQGERLHSELASVMQKAGLSWGDLDVLGVGRGPGNYSGLRISLAAAQALALPDDKPVHAVSSGEALAALLLEESGGAPVAIAGNARRGRLWLGVFRSGDPVPVQDGGWMLVEPEELPRRLVPGSLLAGPDAEIIKNYAASIDFEGINVVHTPRFPEARSVAARVRERLTAGYPSEPLSPLYLHPPV